VIVLNDLFAGAKKAHVPVSAAAPVPHWGPNDYHHCYHNTENNISK